MVFRKNSFSIGIPDIDGERELLLKIFKKVLEALDHGKKDHVFALIKEKFIPLIEKYREREESLMRKIGYPDLEKHKEEHENLLKRLRLLADLEDLDQLRKELSFFCFRVVRHLLKEDMKFRRFYKKNFSNKTTLDSELERIFEELLLTKSRDFTKYVKDEFHVAEIVRKQVEITKDFLYSSQDKKIQAIKSYILSVFENHAKLGICLDDLVDFIENLSKKILNLHKLGILEGIPERRVDDFISFLKQAAYRKYLENNLEYLNRVSRFKFKELDKEFEVIGQVLESLYNHFISDEIKEFDLDLYDFSKIENYLHSLKFMLQSYVVNNYANLLIVSYYRFLDNLQELVSDLKSKSFEKAFFLTTSLIKEVDVFGSLLFYVKSLWQKNPQDLLFKLLADPVNVDKVVGVIFLKGPSTTTSRNIFLNFCENLHGSIPESLKSNLLFFEFIDFKKDVYRGYIIAYPLKEEEKKYRQIVLSIFTEAKEKTEKNLLIGDIVDDYISLVFLDMKKLLENFKFDEAAVSLFIEELEIFLKSEQENRTLTEKDYEKLISLVKIDLEVLKFFKNKKDLDFLLLFCQPIFEANSGSIIGVEVLSRIKLGNNLVSAGKFINVIKREKLMTDFDLLVLEKLRSLIEGICKPRDFKIFLNLFPSSYFDPTIHRSLEELKELAKEKTGGLVLEVTEQENFDFTQMVNYLTKYEVDIALDDFGSGYANLDKFLTMIRYEKTKFLKLSSAFSKNIRDPITRGIVESVCSMASKLGKYVIFEAIEDKETLEEVMKISEKIPGSILIQGFYLSKPKPLVDFLKYSSS
ncbi:hemerythrin-like metal-binding protein [Thermovibrio guaymasensis]|uniref:Hemerythrin-like metal-binding protein n=1 Tax=Thermovibrio guaymasensis TaxID=240167 RepID=A0A420W5M2_9BACT|nr:EAL domain-containing protein [Thermovibrio guaymasensis]RKQ60363.1 hemerythrin-like metal-binding protein [Thermovibrio guaymasensis]